MIAKRAALRLLSPYTQSWAMLPNRFFDTDAQVRSWASPTRFVCAGQVRR